MDGAAVLERARAACAVSGGERSCNYLACGNPPYCAWQVPRGDIESSSAQKLQEMSELEQKFDLEMSQKNFSGQRYFLGGRVLTPIGLPCVLGCPRWFREYFSLKMHGT